MGNSVCCPQCEEELNRLSEENDKLINDLYKATTMANVLWSTSLYLAKELRKERERNGPQ